MKPGALKLNRSAYVLLGVLVLVLLWIHSMDETTRKLKARAAAARVAAGAAGTIAGGTGAASPGAGSVAGAAAGVPPATSLSSTAAASMASQSLASLRAAPWGADPFWKVNRRSADTSSSRSGENSRPAPPLAPQLKGIIWGGASPAAQIGDEIAHEGDTVQGWKVVRIRPDQVTLAERGVVVQLHLREDQP